MLNPTYDLQKEIQIYSFVVDFIDFTFYKFWKYNSPFAEYNYCIKITNNKYHNKLYPIMKKKLLIATLFLISISTIAQDVKVKKDILSLNKNEVCKLIKIELNHYDLKDLNDKDILSFKVESENIISLKGDETFKFFKFSKPNNNDVYFCDYDNTGLKFSLSNEKNIVRHLVKKNEFISDTGINYDKINDFFAEPRPRNSSVDEKIAQFKEAYKVVKDFDLKFDKNNIIKGGAEDIIIGHYKTNYNSSTKQTIVKVYDATNFLTGTYQKGKISLFNKNSIDYTLKSTNSDEIAKRVIERMIMSGYTLGDMQTKQFNINRENHKNEVLAEMKTSDNIYKKEATVYTAEGEKIEGILTLEFYELESEKSGMSSLQNYGGVASLKTKKENGKDKYTTYKAKDGVKICLKESGDCYAGIATKGVTGPKFNLIVNDTENLKLYKSITSKYHILKKDSEEKGIIVEGSTIFKKDNSEKMFEKLFEYLNDCPTLKDNLNTSEINLDEAEGLKKIITAYKNCK